MRRDIANLVEAMKQILPPPERPIAVPTAGDWERCEAELTVLPDDYKAFIHTYGVCNIDFFMHIYDPALSLVEMASQTLSALRTTRDKFPDMFPMPCFPEPGGFLPFGGTDNGDSMYWVTIGEPNTWTVAVLTARAPEVYRYNGGMLEFLVDVLSRKHCCKAFPDSFPDDLPHACT